MEDLDKKYYKIKDVAELLGVAPSTLRYWETEFPEIKPKRSRTNLRYYTPDTITVLRMINYLLKIKGLRIDAAKEELKNNRKNVSKRIDMIELLTDTKSQLEDILSALNKRK